MENDEFNVELLPQLPTEDIFHKVSEYYCFFFLGVHPRG